MISSVRLYDKDIRLTLLEWLVGEYTGTKHIIALEARYGHNARRADVVLYTDTSHAFEIKSDVDSLAKLANQLHDYRRTFEFLTIVTTKKHLPQVRKIMGRNDGLLLVDQHKVIELRMSNKNKALQKVNLLAMCSKATLAKHLDKPVSALSLEILQELALKRMSLNDLKELASEEAKRRFKARYELFLKETCFPYRETDLKVLQHGNRLNFVHWISTGKA